MSAESKPAAASLDVLAASEAAYLGKRGRGERREVTANLATRAAGGEQVGHLYL